MTIFESLIKIKQEKGAGYLVLLDPDKWEKSEMIEMARMAEESGVDAILMGGSLLLSASLDEIIQAIKAKIHIPVIIFPGSLVQISKFADAIFFLSLISGRNSNYLIGEQIQAAPLIKAFNIEPISVGYMLIESGRITSAEFMSNSRPIPRDKLDIVKATALAAQYLGMKMVYLEAGSGADQSVPDDMIRAVMDYTNLPIIVGGGIRTPEEAQRKAKAGAAFVVTGNILENKHNSLMMKEFAEAIHYLTPRREN